MKEGARSRPPKELNLRTRERKEPGEVKCGKEANERDTRNRTVAMSDPETANSAIQPSSAPEASFVYF